MGSVVIGDQGSFAVGIGGQVVPDAGGHGQQSLSDPGIQALGGAATVPFQVELALEGVVDRLRCRRDGFTRRRVAANDGAARVRVVLDPGQVSAATR
jgi:hypothetical protein